jgi:hypothetical protein
MRHCDLGQLERDVTPGAVGSRRERILEPILIKSLWKLDPKFPQSARNLIEILFRDGQPIIMYIVAKRVAKRFPERITQIIWIFGAKIVK